MKLCELEPDDPNWKQYIDPNLLTEEKATLIYKYKAAGTHREEEYIEEMAYARCYYIQIYNELKELETLDSRGWERT
jgi:hypothetical protein